MGAFDYVSMTSDGDCDGDGDLVDVLSFADCFTEPGGPAEFVCEPYDSDADNDVDLAGLVVIQALFTSSQ